MQLKLQVIYRLITTAVDLVLLVGLFIAYCQLRATQRALKAQVLVRLTEEWRDDELYRAVCYIHDLRRQWKSSPVKKWDELATQWVQHHADRDPDSPDPSERRLYQEWQWRRSVSQFLSKKGLMMISGYLTPDDLFGVIPEMGRLLAVLTPIEIAIREYWTNSEQARIAEWDRPSAKWEFNEVWRRYQSWYKRRKDEHKLQQIDWDGIASTTEY